MAEIRTQEQFEKVRDALKAGQFADDPAVEAEILEAAEAWKAQQNTPVDRGPVLRHPLSFLSEGLIDVLSGAPASIAGGAAAFPVAGTNPDEAKEIFDKVSGAVQSPFRARSEGGQAVASAIAKPFELIERGVDFLGEKSSEATDSPGVGAGVKTALLSIPSLFGTKSSVGPRGFRRGELTHQQQVLSRAQENGYVVPTSSANPASTSRS